MLGFLRWQFSGCYKSAQFWAFATMLLALVAKLGGCPGNIPFYTLMTGLAVSLIDTVIWLVRWQIRLYELEQSRIVRELSKK